MLNKLVLLFLVPTLCYSLSITDIKLKLKDTFKDLFGKALTVKVFGEDKEIKPTSYKLPKIPKVDNSATDTSIYRSKAIDLKKTKFNSLNNSEKEKFRASFLKELFQVTSKTRLSKEDLLVYLDRFNQGVSREGIYRSIVSGKDYYEIERSPTVVSKSLVSFTQKFAKKYLSTEFRTSSLINSNRYVIKRIITDKVLDVAEVLSNNPDELYRWYAILSSEISKYPIWKNKIRKNNLQTYHYNWAQSVPFSHVKSELIIKLHKLYNFL